MLKKITTLILLLISVEAFACLRAVGALAVDGEKWKLDQKIEADKEYAFPMGSFILRFTIIEKDKKHVMKYVVEEKKGASLVLVTKGQEEDIESGKSHDIFAKGEQGQPNSIITIKLTNI